MITELPNLGTAMVSCSTVPPVNLISCSPGTHTSTVSVVPGNVSTMTIAFVTNK